MPAHGMRTTSASAISVEDLTVISKTIKKPIMDYTTPTAVVVSLTDAAPVETFFYRTDNTTASSAITAANSPESTLTVATTKSGLNTLINDTAIPFLPHS